MPIVGMPDGTQVSFPDDMPADQIRSLIQQKFPQETGTMQGARQPGSALQEALRPFTSYPETYANMRDSSSNQMARGVEQLQEPTGGDLLGSVGTTLKGLGNLAGGALGYTTSPINAALRTIIGNPLQETVGIPKELSETVASFALPIPGASVSLAGKAAKAAERIPSTEELFRSGAKGYEAARNADFAVAPDLMEMLRGKIKSDLHGAGYRDYVPAQSSIFRALDELPTGRYGDVNDINAVRQVLNNAAKNPEASDAARRAIGHIDEFMGSKVPELAPARSDFAAAYRASDLEDAMAKADRSASNYTKAVQDKARSLRNNDRAMRGWSDEEKAQLDKIISGRAANLSSKVASALGGRGGWWGIVTGVKTGGAAPAAGFGFQKLSDALTSRQVEKLSEMLRSRSDLARQLSGPIGDWGNIVQEAQVSPTAKNLSRLFIASRNLSTNLKDANIAISPNDLLKSLYSNKSAGAESNSDE